MSQEFWVILIVATAVGYLLWRWLPVRWRQRFMGARGVLPANAGCDSCRACAGCPSARGRDSVGRGAGRP